MNEVDEEIPLGRSNGGKELLVGRIEDRNGVAPTKDDAEVAWVEDREKPFGGVPEMARLEEDPVTTDGWINGSVLDSKVGESCSCRFEVEIMPATVL